MKDYQIIYRYGSSESSNGEYAHPTFDFIIQDTRKDYPSHNSLFTLVFQNNKKEGQSILKSYAPYVERLDLDSYYIEETLRVLKKLSTVRTIKQVVQVLKTAKIERMVYDSESYSYFPYRYRKVRDLFFQAREKGLSLTA